MNILNGNQPVFIQIKDYYLSLIAKGTLKEGEALPSVREVALFFGVNPNTVQRSFTLLVEEGYVVNIPKKGFYVKKKDVDTINIIKKTLEDLYNLGISNEEIIKVMKGEKDD